MARYVSEEDTYAFTVSQSAHVVKYTHLVMPMLGYIYPVNGEFSEIRITRPFTFCKLTYLQNKYSGSLVVCKTTNDSCRSIRKEKTRTVVGLFGHLQTW
jgi:hypothetical protein